MALDLGELVGRPVGPNVGTGLEAAYRDGGSCCDGNLEAEKECMVGRVYCMVVQKGC